MSNDLSEVIAAHEATNAKLLLRLAELEKERDAIFAELPATTNGDCDMPGDVRYLREQVATLTQQLDAAKMAEAHAEMGAASDAIARTNAEEELKGARLVISAGLGVAQGQLPKVIEAVLGALRYELDAAKADAARLRETAERWLAAKRARAKDTGSDDLVEAEEAERLGFFTALSATDSSAWLESKIAERTALHVEREKSLEQQLVAATNDAARAELRARDLKEAGKEMLHNASLGVGVARMDRRFGNRLVAAFDEFEKALKVSPDSDERLREVMLKLSELVVSKCGKDANITFHREAIDEVLRGGA